jgi:hypothetical protein
MRLTSHRLSSDIMSHDLDLADRSLPVKEGKGQSFLDLLGIRPKFVERRFTYRVKEDIQETNFHRVRLFW